MTWTPPPGMAAEPLHARADGPADVALVTLAPGAVTPWESHADAVEHLRLLSGCLCVEVKDSIGTMPVDLSEVSGRLSLTLKAGVRHRLVNPFRSAPAVFLVVMRALVEDDRTAYARALDDAEEALRREAEAFGEDIADAIVTAGNVALDSLRQS